MFLSCLKSKKDSSTTITVLVSQALSKISLISLDLVKTPVGLLGLQINTTSKSSFIFSKISFVIEKLSSSLR